MTTGRPWTTQPLTGRGCVHGCGPRTKTAVSEERTMLPECDGRCGLRRVAPEADVDVLGV